MLAVMDEYDDQPTPYHDTMTPNEPSPWSFHDAHPDATPEREWIAERPRVNRRSSLPRVLFAPTSSSIFGAGTGMEQQPLEQQARPPLLAVSGPSQENMNPPQPPLSTLAGPPRRTEYEEEIRATVDRRRIPTVEKDADDPTTPRPSSRSGVNRHGSTTLTTLSRLFAVQAPVSTENSRHSSYLQPTRHPSNYVRNLQTVDIADLPNHLYTRGLLEGRHSDIVVNAFGHGYKLHRIVLDRAPFFATALSEPWLESNAKDMTVHPEDIDSSISQSSFELALKRLYGCSDVREEDSDAVGLFATGCWLEMQDLIDSSIESMLRQMMPETLSPLMKLVTSNYYGRAGDKILASAKAMLCRDGWKMPMRFWDGIPGDIVREIVGGDGFFIDGEWDRWVLAKRVLDRRLRARAIEAGLVEPGSRRRVQKAPDTANLMAVRFDGVYRKNSIAIGSRGVPDALHRWMTLYTHPDIEPMLVLLDEGIHYVHLDFEQLQFIRRAKDCLGLPVMPEKVISSALWQQMELRQKVMNVREAEMELNLSVKCSADGAIAGMAGRDTTMSITTPSEPPPQTVEMREKSLKGKHKATEVVEDVEEDIDSGSWDGNGKPRKFWIPSSDCNIVMGGNAEPVIATSNNTTLQRHAGRHSATIQLEDIQWASDFAAITSQPRPPTSDGATAGSALDPQPEVRYTHFPPFRFAAEFPNPRLLKEKKRVYSRTVFYAGSLWNIYIQKVVAARGAKQLGVYLHRAKERETEEAVAQCTGTMPVGVAGSGSVDERIGLLEREMLARSERRERRQRRRRAGTVGGGVVEGERDAGESSGDAADATAVLGEGASSNARANTMRSLLARGSGGRNAGQQSEVLGPSSSSPATSIFTNTTADGPDNLTQESETDDSAESDVDEDDNETDSELAARMKLHHVPTLPPYVDARPTIKTYFKIYSPSRGGRMLSVYESAPDRFNFSQSWGWKSSTLMLDEGLLGEDGGGEVGGEEDDGVGGKVGVRTMKGKGDGKLRFMVVIGNI